MIRPGFYRFLLHSRKSQRLLWKGGNSMDKELLVKGLSIVLPIANVAVMLASNWLGNVKTEEKIAKMVEEAVENQK